MPNSGSSDRRELVLVGGGHAHVQVLRGLAMRPIAGLRTTVVLDRTVAVYSGMIPGFVAGDYRLSELEIDVWPLARRGGARVIAAAAVDVDPLRRRIALEGRPSIAYDVASLDVGSTVRGLDVPGVREHAFATRPIGHFAARLDAELDRLAGQGDAPRVAVVGAGAAGCELAFTLRARLRARGLRPHVALFAADPEIWPGQPARARRVLLRETQRADIEIVTSARVESVEPDGLRIAGRTTPVTADLVVWATGAAALPFPGATALPRDADGFVRVRDTLQVEGHDDLFAVGDCARPTAYPWVPRAGVYAVRQGPFLLANVRARLAGGALRPYRPQRDFLSLLNLGEGRALGSKWGHAMVGGALLRLKDRIDRRFMERFQVLDADGAPNVALEKLGAMDDDGPPMECGGCAAKLAAQPLAAALGRLPAPARDEAVRIGLDAPDDAAVFQPSGEGPAQAITIDAFRAFSEDEWLVGRAAATNAVSDLLAKGVEPRHALALVTLPRLAPERAEEALYQVLQGVRATLDPLGVSLIGGHTTLGEDLLVGLVATGEVGAGALFLALGGARVGDALLLTKPLGTGVVLAADGEGRAAGAWVEAAHASMLRSNAEAGRLARELGAHAATDVTGFGLVGHLASLLDASGLSARIDASALPALPGARRLLAAGHRSTAHPANAMSFALRVEGRSQGAVAEREPLLFDPQTSGGLLLAVPPERAEPLRLALAEAGEVVSRIGEVAPPGQAGPGRIELLDTPLQDTPL